MDFLEILNDLDAATEGINSDARRDYKALQRQVSAASSAASQAMKAGKYKEAIKHCDEGIAALNAFKSQLQSSESDGAIAGNAIVAAKTMAKAVLGALAALGVAKAGSHFFSGRNKAAKEAFIGEMYNRVDALESKITKSEKEDHMTRRDQIIAEMKQLRADIKNGTGKGTKKGKQERLRILGDELTQIGTDLSTGTTNKGKLEQNYKNHDMFNANYEYTEKENAEKAQLEARKKQKAEQQATTANLLANSNPASALRQGPPVGPNGKAAAGAGNDTTGGKSNTQTKKLLTGKNIAIGAAGAGVVAALGSFIKNMSSGKNANIAQLIKGCDLSIKSLETIKAQAKSAMTAKESFIDVDDEYALAEEAFYMGVCTAAFPYSSICESLLSCGFTDNETAAFYIANC